MCGACAGERHKFDSIGVGFTGAPRLWPVPPRMCGACAGERRKFDSIGAGATGTPRPGPFQATDVRGVRGGA